MEKEPLYNFSVSDTVYHLRNDLVGTGMVLNKTFEHVYVQWSNGSKAWVLANDLRPQTLPKECQPDSTGILKR